MLRGSYDIVQSYVQPVLGALVTAVQTGSVMGFW